MAAWCEETPSVHRSGESVKTKLHRIAEKARKEPGFKFTSLYHLMNEELLRECFQRLRKDAVAGTDKVTKEEPIIERVDVLVSWNFKHIVNLNRIHLLNSVNLKLGYPILEIRSPLEVIYDE